ncbi:MAG: hypothetical protein HYZ11_08180 [Candidatus Tectomicrobia bacterium]|uniref:Lipoprotein n=1 Tax=Tectimicrobiota bacterium TaxID=2528274 RepID=A0A932I1K2_UNCTE|nr:hypothetical protein [Candidatus Tectomicrobia bacterium]
MTSRLLILTAWIALAPAALGGCASTEIAKGDVLRVDRRELPAEGQGHRLLHRGPGAGAMALETVRLCPVQERRIYQEVEVRRESAALAAVSGVGCGVQKFGEIANLTTGRNVVNRSSCTGESFTGRQLTGRTIEGPWEIVRREPCGAGEPPRAGERLGLFVIRSGERREYALGGGGRFQVSADDLAKLRIYFTLLKDIEVEASHAGKTWRQKIDLE